MKTKKHRLDKEIYATNHPVSITTRVEGGCNAFVNDEIFSGAERILLNVLDDYQMDSVVYLFMPNHVHTILQRKTGQEYILDAVNMFKQKSGFWFYENKTGFTWQTSYYDHIIRDEKDIYNQVMYILYNPVRADLVKNWKDYKYKGSTMYKLDSGEQ
jgi:REP element-mobilizing transposase RayT